MKKNILFLLCVFAQAISLRAQEAPSNEERARADAFILRLISTLDNAQDIRRFGATRDSLIQTLNDINAFVQSKNVQERHYNNLRAAYGEALNLYNNNLNQLRNSLSSLTRNAANAQNMRRAIMDWVNNLNPSYTEPFRQINDIRTNRMLPLLDSVRKDAGVKALPLIPMLINGLIQYGPEVMRLFREFDGDRRNFSVRILRYVVDRMADRWFVQLTKKLELPLWDEKVAAFQGFVPLLPPNRPSENRVIPPPPAPPVNEAIVLLDRDYGDNGSIPGPDGTPAIVFENGRMAVSPLNFRQGNFPWQAAYSINTSLQLVPYERSGNWLPECHAFIWNGTGNTGTSGISRGNYLTVLNTRNGYLLSYGTFSQAMATGTNGQPQLRRTFTQIGSMSLPGFDPSVMQNVVINCQNGISSIKLGNYNEVRMNHENLPASAGDIAYGFYNGTNTFATAAAQRQRRTLLVDHLNISTAGTESTRDISLVGANRTRYHVVCVGISDYADNSLDLNYAVKDARAMNALFDFYNKADVQTYLVTDRAATHNGILDTLRKALNNARPQDVLLFFYSGHGEEGGLIPHDYRRGVPSSALSYTEIMNVLNQKRLKIKGLILDACHSGSAASSMLNAGNASKDLGRFDQMNQVVNSLRDGQVFGLCSSTSSQVSYESRSLEHGVFTYYVLSALRQGDFDRSGIVSLGELNWFLKNTMNRSERQSYQLTGNIQFRMPLMAQ